MDQQTKLAIRPTLVKALQDSGALIFERVLTGGHKVYVVMPGEDGEVKDEHCNTVWGEIAAALHQAADTAATVGAMPNAHLNVKGGSA